MGQITISTSGTILNLETHKPVLPRLFPPAGCPGPFPEWVLWWGHYHILAPPAEVAKISQTQNDEAVLFAPEFQELKTKATKSLTHSVSDKLPKMDEFESLLLMLQTLVILFKVLVPFKHVAFLEGLTHNLLKPFDGQQNTKWDSYRELKHQWHLTKIRLFQRQTSIFVCQISTVYFWYQLVSRSSTSDEKSKTAQHVVFVYEVFPNSLSKLRLLISFVWRASFHRLGMI